MVLVWLIFGFGLRAMFSMPLRWLKASVVGILLPCGLRRVNRNIIHGISYFCKATAPPIAEKCGAVC